MYNRSKKEIKYFKIAREISKLSDINRVKIGAILVHHNNIISVGFNKTKTHPIQKKLNELRFSQADTKNNGQIHGEVQAILNAKDTDLSKATMYIYRENKHGNIACCRPCKACMSLIKERGIKTICYTSDDGYCVEELV